MMPFGHGAQSNPKNLMRYVVNIAMPSFVTNDGDVLRREREKERVICDLLKTDNNLRISRTKTYVHVKSSSLQKSYNMEQ